jgi:hypothetical protein
LIINYGVNSIGLLIAFTLHLISYDFKILYNSYKKLKNIYTNHGSKFLHNEKNYYLWKDPNKNNNFESKQMQLKPIFELSAPNKSVA